MTRMKIQEASKDLQMGGRPKNDEKSKIGPRKYTPCV